MNLAAVSRWFMVGSYKTVYDYGFHGVNLKHLLLGVDHIVKPWASNGGFHGLSP